MWATDPDFEVDGLYYAVREDGTVEIVAPQGEVYDGEITIPATVTYGGTTYNVTRIDKAAFSASTISGSLVIPATILTVGEGAFTSCSGLTEVTFEASETPLIDENEGTDNKMFGSDDNIATVNIYRDLSFCNGAGPNGKQTSPFASRRYVKYVTIGGEMTVVPDYMFYVTGASSMETITFTDDCKVVEVSQYAFNLRNSAPLSTLTLPATLETLGQYAFYNLPNLATIYSLATTPPTCASNALGAFASDVVIYVPAGSGDAYKAADVWSNFDIQEFDATGVKAVETVGDVEVEGYYTVGGQKIGGLQKGVNIVRYTDGTSKKVIK